MKAPLGILAIFSLITCSSRSSSAQEAEAPPAPSLRVADEGWVEVGALLQVWAFWEHQRVPDRAGDARLGVRLRRAELKLSGTVIPDRLRFGLMIDPARVVDDGFETRPLPAVDPAGAPLGTVRAAQPRSSARFSVLQDAFVTVLTPVADVSLGQFKTPISWEGFNSTSKLLLPERAVVSTALGDRRDLGLKLDKGFLPHDGKKGPRLRYVLTLTSGQGQNVTDRSLSKDLALRLEGMPAPWLMIGLAGLSTVGPRESTDPSRRRRLEGDLRVTPGPFLLQAEVLHGVEEVGTGTGVAVTRTESQGFYGAAGVTFGKVQPVVRVGHYDPDTSSSAPSADGTGLGEGAWTFEAGVNLLYRGDHAKVQMAFGRTQFDEAEAHHRAIVGLQVSF